MYDCMPSHNLVILNAKTNRFVKPRLTQYMPYKITKFSEGFCHGCVRCFTWMYVLYLPIYSTYHNKVRYVYTIHGMYYVFPCSVHQHLIKWWRHQMEAFSAWLALCARNSSVIGEFPSQSPVTRSFDIFFDLRLNKRLSKQSWGWWIETPSRLSWRHCNQPIISEKHHMQ